MVYVVLGSVGGNTLCQPMEKSDSIDAEKVDKTATSIRLFFGFEFQHLIFKDTVPSLEYKSIVDCKIV